MLTVDELKDMRNEFDRAAFGAGGGIDADRRKELQIIAGGYANVVWLECVKHIDDIRRIDLNSIPIAGIEPFGGQGVLPEEYEYANLKFKVYMCTLELGTTR